MTKGINREARKARQARAVKRKEYFDGLSDEQQMDPKRGPKVLKKLVKRQLQREGRSA